VNDWIDLLFAVTMYACQKRNPSTCWLHRRRSDAFVATSGFCRRIVAALGFANIVERGRRDSMTTASVLGSRSAREYERGYGLDQTEGISPAEIQASEMSEMGANV
jgi:hypothetical protein